MNTLTIADIASDLRLSPRTVQRYCKEGFLPARLSVNQSQLSYEVDSSDYLNWKTKHFSGLKKGEASKYTRQTKELTLDGLRAASEEWLEWSIAGKINGKPIGLRTIEIYRYYFNLYLKRLGKNPRKPLISVENLREVLGTYKPENFATKRNIYEATMSIARYLVIKEKFEAETREAMKALKPKRFLPARKTSLTEQQIQQLLEAIKKMNNSSYDKLTAKTLVIFLANTGLRASECCKLKLEDVDLENRRIFVKLGKGNKDRSVGINSDTFEALLMYLKARARYRSEYFFVNRLESPFTVNCLSKKIATLAKIAKLKSISPHSLRRSFVTINAGKGKPLNHLRIACGHSDISTTQSYCMTSIDEVVDAMKGW